MPADSFDTIKYEVDGHTATITLNRPEALNALSPHMITELRAAYDEAENDDNVWLLVVTGTGRAFCTGADVKAIPGDGKVIYERPYLSTYEQWEAPQEGTPPFRRMAKPILAATLVHHVQALVALVNPELHRLNDEALRVAAEAKGSADFMPLISSSTL